MLAENGALADHDRSGRAHSGMRLRPLHRHGPVAPTPAASRCAPSTATLRAAAARADAKVYLVSPETAAASALTGVLTDPAHSRRRRRSSTCPSTFCINDNMIVPPAPPKTKRTGGGAARAQHQALPADRGRWRTTSRAKVLLKVGDNITTDHIMPAGAKILPYRSNIPYLRELLLRARATPNSPRAARQRAAASSSAVQQLRPGLLPRACGAGAAVSGHQAPSSPRALPASTRQT